MVVPLYFFSSRRRHTRSLCDWSSDVCSSDLRVASPGWWGRTVEEVCHKPFQFSCWLASDPNRSKLASLSRSGPSYGELYAVCKSVIDGDTPDPTAGATHYKVTGTKASWDGEVATRGIVPVVIDHHSFFKIGLH